MTTPDDQSKSSNSHILVGETYEVMSWIKNDPEDGRRAVVVDEGGWCTVRWANGLESRISADRLRGPVEPLRPGVDEPCLACVDHSRSKSSSRRATTSPGP